MEYGSSLYPGGGVSTNDPDSAAKRAADRDRDPYWAAERIQYSLRSIQRALWLIAILLVLSLIAMVAS